MLEEEDNIERLSDPFDGLYDLSGKKQDVSCNINEIITEKIIQDLDEGPHMTKPIEVSAKELVGQLKKGKALYNEFSIEFNEQYMISGKLIDDWKEYFKLEVPPDLNPRLCQGLDIKLMELHQEAAFFKASCQSKLEAYRSRYNAAYRTTFTALVAKYKAEGSKRPAKDTLVTLAEYEIGNILDAIVHAEIELNFWKEVLSDMANCRKLIENATFNLGIEAKALQAEKIYDGMQRRNGGSDE